MGDVYKAFDPSLKRHVALKVLAPELNRDSQFVQRFNDEAASIARLLHPNILQVYFTGEDAGRYFFAMQYVDGQSLADLLNGEPRLEPDRAITITIQVLNGLSAAHAEGMVHRDIKPANILLTRNEQALVADFGLVKSQGEGITIAGVVLGTVDYMSPEQAIGETGDARSDLYSVGVVMYRMLTGKNPFQADSPSGVIYQHQHQEPASLSSVCNLRDRLADVVHRLLEKSPDDRYQSAIQVRNDLQAIVDGTDGSSVETSEQEVKSSVPAAATTHWSGKAVPPSALDISSNHEGIWWKSLPSAVVGFFTKRLPRLFSRSNTLSSRSTTQSISLNADIRN